MSRRQFRNGRWSWSIRDRPGRPALRLLGRTARLAELGYRAHQADDLIHRLGLPEERTPLAPLIGVRLITLPVVRVERITLGVNPLGMGAVSCGSAIPACFRTSGAGFADGAQAALPRRWRTWLPAVRRRARTAAWSRISGLLLSRTRAPAAAGRA